MDKDSHAESALLRLDRVSKSFDMGEVTVEVLRGFTLDVERREFLAVVGPSGSGKTTLLNLIGGLDSPTSGTIWYEDQRLSDFSSSQLTSYRRTEIGFVFQLYNLVPNLTAYENVAVATELCDDPIPIDQALDMVGLTPRATHFPSQLSGGEQQRVAIARAVAKKPKLLLCDEPTGALDFSTGRQVLRALRDLNQQLQTTVVVITHNAALAQVADRSVHLRSGEVSQVEKHDCPVDPLEVTW